MVDIIFHLRVSAIEITSIMSDLIVFLVFLPHQMICQNRKLVHTSYFDLAGR